MNSASRHPCAHDVVENIREWPGEDFKIGECARCKSTVVAIERPAPKPVTVKRGSRIARLLRVRSRKANASK